MEKPSTKKPMNILKTMVFLKNFMKNKVKKIKKTLYLTKSMNTALNFTAKDLKCSQSYLINCLLWAFCWNNQQPILELLERAKKDTKKVN